MARVECRERWTYNKPATPSSVEHTLGRGEMKLGTNGKLGVSPLVHSGAIAHHMLTKDPERLKRLDRGLPDAFPDDYGRIPNNPITAAVFASILKGGPQARSLQGGWSAADDGRLIYRHFGKKGGQVIIYLDVPGQELTLDEQWETVERFNMLTTDALIVALAQLCEPSALGKTRCPLMEPVTISSSAIMRYKGMTRWGAERAAFQNKLADEMDAICSIRFDIIDFPGLPSFSQRHLLLDYPTFHRYSQAYRRKR